MSIITKDRIKEKALEIGFHQVGITNINSLDSEISNQSQNLKNWLAKNYHADMAWMTNPKRQNIQLVMPEVRSLICVTLNYYTPHPHSHNPQHAKISRYAWGRDYHKILHKKLKSLASWLQSLQPNIKTLYYADTGPISDKFWAQQAGIGWIAKNGNLITRQYGSWVFLGEILTNLELTPDQPHSQHCGTCTRCITACPTDAITQPFIVDANKCIAYHTIENRAEKLPEHITKNMQNWVAGCDICQDVCPWNQRFAQATNIADFQPYPWNLSPNLTDLATISHREWESMFPASALRRIKPPMLRRNAQANLDNQN